MRVGLVGLGGHGETIQRAVEHAAALVVAAVYDPVETHAGAASRRFGCAVASSYEALLRRDDLDAVVLVTPNALHRRQVEAAIEAGRHVFVEKPIANTVADGRAMVEAAEAKGRVLIVGHNMRYGRAARQAHKMLNAGRLGKVVSIEIHFSSDTIRRLPSDAWRLQPDQCPLLPVMQLGIHAIDLAHYLLGPIVEVHAFAQSVTTSPGVIDSVVASLRMENGTLGTLVSHYCTQVTFAYRLAGTDGTLRCTPHRVWFRRNDDTDEHGDGAAETYDYAAHESYVLQMEAFGEAVRRRTPPETDGWTGLQAVAVVEALHRSTETGTPQLVRSFADRVP